MRSTKKALDYCYYCPSLCRSACPVAEADHDETSTPQAKMTTMRLLIDKKIPWTKEAALQAYKCSDCGQATEACELDNPVAPMLDQFRSLAFKRGLAPESVYHHCEKFKKRNNPYNVKLIDRLKKHLPEERFKPAAVTYFPGCTEIYHDFDAIHDTFELLDKLGVEKISVFDKPIQCCGYPLFAAGDIKGFREHAEVMMHFLEEYPLLISAAPACLFTLKEIYAAHGFSIPTHFLHISEFLEPYFEQKNIHIKRSVTTSVAYHDPCYLGRYLNVYESPRRLIQMVCGEVLKEFRRSRNESYCCGGGGLLSVSRPQTAEVMIKNRLAEFEETGARTLVTSCPTCVRRFRQYGGKIKVRGLVSFLNQAVEADGRRSGKKL